MKSRSLVLFDIDGTLLRGAGQHHKEALLEGIRKITGHAASFDGIETAGRLDHELIEDLLRKCGAAHKTIRSALKEIAFECQRFIEQAARATYLLVFVRAYTIH